jgi:hypothetical protein
MGRDVIEVVLCQTGMGRHDPGVGPKLAEVGATLATVECFDKCETCELFLIARIDGATLRFRTSGELVEALVALGEG